MEILTVSQASKYCNVSTETIINWMEAGGLPALKTVGGHRRVRKDDLDKFLQKKSIHVKVISESNEIDLFKKFKVELPNTEAVFLVEGARLASWSCDIQELCKEKSVVLYNGSIHAVRNGSSLLGYGIDYQIIAKKLSEQALAILKNNSSPQTIPVLKIENARFACLSQKVANSQNFTVPENISRKWNIKYF